MSLRAAWIPKHQADLFVALHHRHHKPAVGDYFRVAAIDEAGQIVGIAQVGRPVARGYTDRMICEVTRLCTDGTRNACSFLYARAARMARRKGFKKIITYILDTEPGTSLRAAGWEYERTTQGGSWDCRTRPRRDKAPTCPKQRWAKNLTEVEP